MKQQVPVQVAIAIQNLSFSYQNRLKVLQNINIIIHAGERVGLIGANGSGKTTLFLLTCGVLKPTAGNIILFDKPVAVGEFRPEIGLVFQNPNDQLFLPSVRDDIAFGPENMGLTATEVEERIQEAVSLTGVQNLIERVPHNLSGGEKCMVAIAGVLAMRPQVVLYDEPSANLDMRSRRRLIQFLQRSPQTMMISSHDLELILEVCDRVLLLGEGQIVADGNPRDIMSNQQLMEAHGLEKPFSLMNL
ncbi:energy-coupling factor ABC transporter ATP-binding protein [Chroococcidiopsis sp. TS-821]|uniref:energy-coupling factor ABC transporter ATP-binding protein n=1 Tax=Chroococcidiopsis sp. TS-821 TaxID=1378066 RepID=UPI000CEE2D78|nr:ABC transporter ATP-binding protein [Chroococcidiopsis sp. TS-821]PPS45586.1 ABC transporter ATP-binding protein [Chroococcidiopsis sp. TS-821]